MPPILETSSTSRAPLPGRGHEINELRGLLNRARQGQSGTLVVSGGAGIGKTALMDFIASEAAAHVRVSRVVASESEMELAYAGIQMLCVPMMHMVQRLPAPQGEALETALGVRVAAAPNPFLVGLAVLGLLTEFADERPLLCIVDDAQWLDDASAQALSFVARRLEAEGIAVVLAMRTVNERFATLPQLVVAGLSDDDARDLLQRTVPAPIDPRVRDQLIAEARGNPLALRELPRSLTPAGIAGGFTLTSSMPLERRIERSLAAQLEPLPESTRLFLLLAAADPTGDPALLWRAAGALGLGQDDADIAESADALHIGARVQFRHPLVRSAVYRSASARDRRRAHAALADATDVELDPDRRAWHRASSIVRPDAKVADDLEQGLVAADVDAAGASARAASIAATI